MAKLKSMKPLFQVNSRTDFLQKISAPVMCYLKNFPISITPTRFYLGNTITQRGFSDLCNALIRIIYILLCVHTSFEVSSAIAVHFKHMQYLRDEHALSTREYSNFW